MQDVTTLQASIPQIPPRALSIITRCRLSAVHFSPCWLHHGFSFDLMRVNLLAHGRSFSRTGNARLVDTVDGLAGLAHERC